jgi:hypothetical protein
MIDSGFDSFGRETPGLGYEDRRASTYACVQGGAPPKCPEGQTAVWDQYQCKWVCWPTTFCPQVPVPKCAAGQTLIWHQDRCEWTCEPQVRDKDGDGGDGGDGKTPLDRVADVIERILAGGGGGIIIPQIPQPQAVVAPTTERRYNPAAIVLLVAGLALGGYYVYQRTRRS